MMGSYLLKIRESKNAFLACAIVLLCYHLPVLFIGENAYVRVNDNLDSEFIYLHLLRLTESLFSLERFSEVDNFFLGLGRNYFHSEFGIVRLIFLFFPSFTAYWVNSLIVRIVGIIGVVALARDYFPRMDFVWVFLLGVWFSFLPIYSLYGLSVMGQPLLLWSFLNLYRGKRKIISYAFVCMFPFYSHLALIGPFAISGLVALVVYTYLVEKKLPHFSYGLGIAVLALLYAVANISMLQTFFSDIIMHRVEVRPRCKSFIEIVKHSILRFFFGQYHGASYNSVPILLLVFYKITRLRFFRRTEMTVVAFIVFICLFDTSYACLASVLGEHIPLLTSFQFNRFAFLLPILWLCVLLFLESELQRKLIPKLLLAASILMLLPMNKELSVNWVRLVYSKEAFSHEGSFRSFFAADMFSQINLDIELPQSEYRVVHLGMHPSVGLYNGFYGLDGYMNSYPLSYKHMFRQIISKELEKSSSLKRYFDQWGNRCYMFSSELESSCFMDCRGDKDVLVEHLDVDVGALQRMGARFIFSAVEIGNAQELGLKHLKTYNSDEYRLRLYQL